jgi:hypothetical protein
MDCHEHQENEMIQDIRVQAWFSLLVILTVALAWTLKRLAIALHST